MFLGFLANLDFLIALAAIIPSVVLGFFAYFRGEQNVSKMMFTLGCVATIFWAVVNYY